MSREVHVRFYEGLELRCSDLLANYYTTGEVLSPAVWTGTFAKELGLDEKSDPKLFAQTFEQMLRGFGPDGKPLIKNPEYPYPQSIVPVTVSLEKKASEPRRAALDLTFSAPKSVSIQALVFGDTRLVAAHRAAVKETLHYIEEHFAQCRVGPKAAREVLVTGKLAVAQFEHDLSREKDPHLHTHNVVMNMTPGNGQIRALHNDELFQNKRMLGTFYRNELALRVRALGYDVELGRQGTFEISGFQREQIESFSKRHMQIWSKDLENQAAAYASFYEKRKAKDKNLDRPALMESWQNAARDLKMSSVLRSSKEGLQAVVGSVLGAPVPNMKNEVAALTEKSVSFRLQDLQIARLASSMGRIETKSVLAECALHAANELVAGQSEDYKAAKFTTQEALAKENNYRTEVQQGIGIFAPFLTVTQAAELQQSLTTGNLLSDQDKIKALASTKLALDVFLDSVPLREKILHSLEQSVQGHTKLSPTELLPMRQDIQEHLRAHGRRGKPLNESLRGILDPFEKHVQAMTRGQIHAVHTTVTSKDAVVVWQGVAGAGKTFSLSHVIDVATKQGYQVQGLAPSSAAAKELGAQTHLMTETVDAHLLKSPGLDQKQSSQLGTNLWIVDEAGMLSASQMESLLVKARQQQARVLLVGDKRQLGSVAAGNPFLDLQRNTATTKATLGESVRQRTPELQEAVTKMYSGNMQGAVKDLRHEIVEAKTLEKRCVLAAEGFLSLSKKEQAQTLVLAKTNEERTQITTAIRDTLKKQGQLQNEVTLKTLRVLDFTELEKQQGHNLKRGYVVVPQQDLMRGVRRGTSHTILNVDLRNNTVHLGDTSGLERTVPCAALVNTSIYLQDTLSVAKGDKILWTRNERSSNTKNNDLFVVSGVTAKGVTLTLQPQASTAPVQKRLLVDESHHLDHAWVLTVHRAQGQTSKNVVLVADQRLTASEFLVGVTRATQNVLIIAHDKTAIENIGKKDLTKDIAHEVGGIRMEQIQNEAKVIQREQGSGVEM